MILARLFICLAMFVPIVFSTGCTNIDAFLSREKNWEADTVMLRKGHAAFEKREYQAAGEIFEGLTKASQDREIARKALFGLAGARLALADDPEAYTAALSLFERWARKLPPELRDEDSRLLGPVLMKSASAQPPSIHREEAVARQKTLRLLRTREKEIQELKEGLESRDREIEKLNQKIEMIQSIDQKIQEKKKGISSP